MGGRLLAAAVAASTLALTGPVWAGGGFHGGGFRPPMGHPGMSGRRGFGGDAWRGGLRAMPPVAGVIHERAGMRPFYSAYGHANTGYHAFGGGWHAGFGAYPGAGGAGWRAGSTGFAAGGFGHVATGFRGEGYGRARFERHWDRERFADGRGLSIYRYGRGYRGYGGGVYGGGGGFYGGSGGYYDGSGIYAGSGGYGGYGTSGSYGTPGTYGNAGTYGGYGTEAGAGGAYLSEPPLAATRTEAPLAPSPYGPDGGYYAPGRSGVAPHILTVDRSSAQGCGCRAGAGAYPVIYRYGVGTAY